MSNYAIPIGTSVSIDDAKKASAAASAEAKKNGWFMAIAVVDPAGTLVYFEKADTTQHGSVQVAIDKARSAALYKRPTKAFQDALEKGGANLRILSLQGAVPVDGGSPLLVQGKLIGAIGVSGDLAEHDGQCAQAGAQTLDVAQVALPNTLVIDGVRFSPNPVRSRLAPIVARFHVSDSRGFSIAGASVLALGLPYGWVRSAPEALTDGAGWATIVMRAGAALPKHGALVVFVRARKPGESVLSGVTARRLVQVGIRR